MTTTASISRLFPVKEPLRRRFSGPLARNTMWALSGHGMRLLIQAVYFIVIARSLGPSQYGGFIATVALMGILSPFVGFGCGSLLTKNVARDRTVFPVYLGNGLFITIISGIGFFSLILATSGVFLPHTVPLRLIACVGAADLLFAKLLDLSAWAFLSFEQFMCNAQINALLSLTRLVGIVALATFKRHPSMTDWAGFYLLASGVAASIATLWAVKALGRPEVRLSRLFTEIEEGLCFAASLSAQTIYNDIDKTMVARLASLQAAGIYGAAYRLIDVAFIPVRALLNAAYPTYFRRGVHGLHSSLQYGKRLLMITLPYPICICFLLISCAGTVPLVLGRDYSYVPTALQWLAIIPLFKTLQFFVADALTGAGHQGVRTLCQAGVAVLNVVVNLWVIPAYGWRGAAWSSLLSDGLLVLALWSGAALLLRRRENRASTAELLTGGPC